VQIERIFDRHHDDVTVRRRFIRWSAHEPSLARFQAGPHKP
jgi:hypothetical protein